MAKEKTVNGQPNTYLVDLSHKTLGRFDEAGEFTTSDPDTIKRLEIMEAEEKALKKESLGERLARKDKEESYSKYKELAEVVADILIERGVIKGAK